MGKNKRGGDANVALSKKMARVLRHRIHENGLGDVLRPDGFVPLASLLGAPGFSSTTVEDVRAVVEANDKQRFTLREETGGTLLIRANQGHSCAGIVADDLLQPLDATAVAALGGRAVHGTHMSAWESIVASGGLSPMRRHHIHLARGLPGEGGVISGMRSSASVHIWVDLAAAIAAGVPFFASDNGVILTPGGASGLLSAEFFDRVVDARTGAEWRGGAWTGGADAGRGSSSMRKLDSTVQ